MERNSTIPELNKLRVFDESKIIQDICKLSSDVEYLSYLKDNHIKFTLTTWDYKTAKRQYYELLHFTHRPARVGRSTDIRVLVKSVAVNDGVNINDHWVATKYIFLSFNKAFKAGVELILDEPLHEGIRIEHMLRNKPRAAA